MFLNIALESHALDDGQSQGSANAMYNGLLKGKYPKEWREICKELNPKLYERLDKEYKIRAVALKSVEHARREQRKAEREAWLAAGGKL